MHCTKPKQILHHIAKFSLKFRRVGVYFLTLQHHSQQECAINGGLRLTLTNSEIRLHQEHAEKISDCLLLYPKDENYTHS